MCSRTIRPNSRCLSFFVFILVAAGATSVAGAAESSPGDLGDPVAPGDPSDKPDSHIGTNPARDGREGGETIADAIFIPEPWFQDTGATCDNIDDYDEICPYPGSTSPDVVYSLEYYGCVYLAVDLYGSSYDTKVYIYDDQMNVLACNDDYYSDFTSRVELYGDYTGIIYIVVDGYGGDCGEYVMFVEGGVPPPPYDVECPDGAQIEQEPWPADGYVDEYNGGCEADLHAFQQLAPMPGLTELDFCGLSGWYVTDGTDYRDTDWFQVIAAGNEITWTVDSQYYWTVCSSAEVIDCDQPWSVLQEMVVGLGVIETMTIATTPGQVVTLWVMPGVVEAPPCEVDPFEYAFHLSGVSGVTAIEPATWSGVKRLYR